MTFDIKRIAYEACFNLGNYENEKIRLEATYSPDQDLTQVIEDLRGKCRSAAQPDANKSWNERQKLQNDIKKLQTRLNELQDNWENVSTFLKAQGIKPDVAEFPQLTNLL